MKENFIFPKNYFNNKPLSLEDSKWNIYQTSKKDIIKQKYKTPPNKLNSNININSNQIQSNYKFNPILNSDIDKKVENIKLSIYSKINQNSSNLLLSLEKIKYLTQENISLKKIINNKDKIISDFEILFRQFKEKFIKMENINQALKNKLLGKNDMNININNKELNLDDNKNDLIDSFNIIKDDLNKIESDYNQKLKEKDEILEKMKEELIYIYNENKNLSDVLEKVNNYIMKTNYHELKNKINDLLEEKELLVKQNKQREERIIEKKKKNEQVLIKEGENNSSNNDDLIVTFKIQENEYVKTINMLQNRIMEKDQEIQMIKEEYNKILNAKRD